MLSWTEIYCTCKILNTIIKLAIIGNILNMYQQDVIVLMGYTIKTLIFTDFFNTSNPLTCEFT